METLSASTDAARPPPILSRMRGRIRRGRSPVGVPPRLEPLGLSAAGATSGQASWDAAGRPILYCRPNRGAKTSRSSTGVTRARLSQSRESTSRTGRNAGPHDARSRPGAAVTSRRARAPQPAPPDGVTGRRPCKRARLSFFSSSRGAFSRNSGGQSHRTDPVRVFFRSLFDARAPKL